MSVSFEGIGGTLATFEAVSGLTAGDCVKMSANGKVTECSNGERFCGAAAYVAGDGHASVLLHGYLKAKYTGTAPSLGWVHLVSDGAGAVKTDAGTGGVYTGGEYLVSDVDAASATVGFWM